MIRHLNLAIALDSNFWAAYSLRGFCHYKKGRHRLAEQDFSKAIGIHPSLAPAYEGRALALASRGDFRAAFWDDYVAAELTFPEKPSGSAKRSQG